MQPSGTQNNKLTLPGYSSKYSKVSHFQIEKKIWAGYLAWARRATARPVISLLSSEQQRKNRSRKTLQCSHLKNTNTARAAWSQLSAASCAILSFIDYSLNSKISPTKVDDEWWSIFCSLQKHPINVLVFLKKVCLPVH